VMKCFRLLIFDRHKGRPRFARAEFYPRKS
jgi:hypothetical protein